CGGKNCCFSLDLKARDSWSSQINQSLLYATHTYINDYNFHMHFLHLQLLWQNGLQLFLKSSNLEENLCSSILLQLMQ
ncbi:hypothetical protein ACH5RR_008736, partial [Cinchona calisaya]